MLKTAHLKKLLGRNLVFHTIDGLSFRGVLTGVYPDSVVLEVADFLADEVQKLEGSTGILRANLSWYQVV